MESDAPVVGPAVVIADSKVDDASVLQALRDNKLSQKTKGPIQAIQPQVVNFR